MQECSAYMLWATTCSGKSLRLTRTVTQRLQTANINQPAGLETHHKRHPVSAGMQEARESAMHGLTLTLAGFAGGWTTHG